MRVHRTICLSVVFIALFPVLLQGTNQKSEPQPPTGRADNSLIQRGLVAQQMGQMPLAFTKNEGQWDEQALFCAKARGATMWFTNEGTYYQFTRSIPRPDDVDGGRQMSASAPADGFDRKPDPLETMAIKTSFTGTNPNPEVVGENLMEYKCNYFIGDDPANWHTDVPNYRAVCLKEVYPGIDLRYYGNGRQLEYDFIASPGADPSQIRLEYEGVNSISTNAAGELIIETDWVTVTEQTPKIYQIIDGEQKQIEGEYNLLSANSFGFQLGENYDPDHPLVIDPVVLVYSTYLGGDDQDTGFGIVVEGFGSVYVTGATESTDFPTKYPYQTHQSWWDVYVTRLNPNGDELMYSTYIGGSDADFGYAIALDNFGNALITGHVWSSNFPTQNPYQTNQPGCDAFVTKLNSVGNALVYSTYLGGNGDDFGYGITVDDARYAYVTGETESTNFPTQNPFQGSLAGGTSSDAFVTKLNYDGNGLMYSTYLGGNGNEDGYDIVVDGDGYAYVTGITNTTDFPTQNPYQDTYGGSGDVYVTKFNTTGNGLIYSTYLGGDDNEHGYGIAIDGSGQAYITGDTDSDDFPTENPYQATNQTWGDAFVAKLNSAGNGLVYSTYLGGSYTDRGEDIAVDGLGYAFVTGRTASVDFPTADEYQTNQLGGDAFVTQFDLLGNAVIFSTYLGGSDDDSGRDIALDDFGNVYITGGTGSSDFPTENPYQTNQPETDAFVTKLSYLPCDCGVWGDVTGDGNINPIDVTYMVQYVYLGNDMRIQPPDCPLSAGDVNCDGNINPIDMTFYTQYVYLTNDMFCADPCL